MTMNAAQHKRHRENLIISHASRTPEQKAAISAKTSASMKKWHAQRNAEDKKRTARKTSMSITKRTAQRPPRMNNDINKKRSTSIIKFHESPSGREHRKYIGYLSGQAMLMCEPKKKARIIKKRTEGQKRSWAEKKLFIESFYERGVPREKSYCGVVTEQELEKMHG